jgi:serine/threonine-protein kinase
MTKTNAVMGSPLYMSPEQLASARDVDMRADVWAMGVILFELLTGRHPFEAETLPQLIASIVTGQPNRLNALRPDLPEAVDTLVMACLQKDRGVRIPTIAEFAMRLVEFAPRRSRVSAERISRLAHVSGFSASALALPPSSEPEKVRPATGGTIAGLGGTIPQAAGPRRILAATALGLVLVSVGVGLFIGRRQSAEPRETTATTAAQAAAPTQALPAEPPKPIETAPAPAQTVVSAPEPSAAPPVSAAAPAVPSTRTPKKTSATTTRPGVAPASRPPAASATPVRSTSAYDDRK